MRSILIVLCLTMAGCATVPSPPPASAPLLSSADLQSDVAVLEHAYESLHPGLLRYNTVQQMAAHFATLRHDLDHDQTRASVYLALSKFAAQIKCGHTYANFYNQSDVVQAELFKARNRVPFYFRWIDGQMIVTRNFSTDARLAPGSQIAAINGIATTDLLQTLMGIARADGSNDPKRISYLEVQGKDNYEAFDIFAPLFYPQINGELKLRVRDVNGLVWTTKVSPLSYQERLLSRSSARTSHPEPWTVSYPRDGVALLTMPTWAMYNTKWDWRGFLEQTFSDLQGNGIRALVIDLRANEGGDDVGNVILAHLVDRDLALPSYRQLVRYRSVPSDLIPFLETWDTSFRDWGDKAQPYDERFFRLTGNENDARGAVITAQAPRFTGRVFVLVGPTNSSATFQFAETAKTSRLATLVGQTTGGNRRGINGGAFFFLKLPHSGLEMDVPLIGTFPVEAQPDAGLEPDIRVAPTVADIASGYDPLLDQAMALATN